MKAKEIGYSFIGALTRSYCCQRALEYTVSVCHALMGIGSTGSESSIAEKRCLNDYVKRLIHKGGEITVFDVGSNIGQYATSIDDGFKANRFTDYRVHCFEPSHATFLELTKNSVGNTHRILNNFGLSKKSGILTLYGDSPTSGCSSLTHPRRQGTKFDCLQQVEIRTLDEYCKQVGVAKIDWLKIDTEGHELDVLEGGSGLFNEKRVSAVYFEFGQPAVESRVFLRDYFYFFEQYDMDIFRVTLSGGLIPLGAYRGSHEQFRACSNYVALAKTYKA